MSTRPLAAPELDERDRARVRFVDVLALLSVPAVLLGASLLPEPLRRSLAFDYTDPSLVTAYTANFVHLSLDHLLANLVSFVLVAGALYLCCVSAARRRLFTGVFTTVLLAFPAVLSLLNLAAPRDAITFGLSAINMAFAGTLLVAVTVYARCGRSTDVDVRIAPGLFLLSLGLIALIAVPRMPVTIATAAVAVIAAGLYLVPWARRDSRSVPAWLRSGLARATRDELLVVSLAIWIGHVYIAFPTVTTTTASVPNLYSHFVGYALGFLVAYLAVELRLLRDDRPVPPADSPA